MVATVKGVGHGIKTLLESAGGGEKGKPHSTSAGRIAAGGRRLKRGFRKMKSGAVLKGKKVGIQIK